MDGSEEVRVLMVAGGTGGHIFPALAVAEELRARSGLWSPPYRIEFVGTHRPLEAKLIPAAGFRLRTVTSAGLKGIGGIQRFRNLAVLPRTMIEVAGILKEFRPQVVVGVGGYLAGPVLLEAALLDIPTILIEPNARPGFTNRLLAPVVRAAAVGFEETAGLFGGKARVTGHPVRRAFFAIPARCSVTPPLLPVPPAQPGVAVSPFTVVVVGGSQGSRAINQAVATSLPLLAADVALILRSPPGGMAAADGGASSVGPGPNAVRPYNPGADLKVGATPNATPSTTPNATSMAAPGNETSPGRMRIIHQTGEHDYNETRKTYHERGVAAEVHAFIDDMPGALAQADLVISRAGATAVSELAAVGRAAILIPFPGATDQHQLENARAMEKAGAARVIVQAELTPERLAAQIRELMASPATLERMEICARYLAKPDAAAHIADMVEEFARR
jgi:UDP-N-acetylglucosamine--N-acetylmuramyl-(pentapeptide) pyrophosphoryl-undecaprenol N-acetylglucosamine transferase